MLKDYCSVSSSVGENDFVGLRFTDTQPHVFFPRGFSFSQDDSKLRREILHLLETIRYFGGYNDGIKGMVSSGKDEHIFPLYSYQYIIYDFLENGYYKEWESKYITGQKGKIHWKKTIQKIHPQIDNGNVVYLDFISKTSRINTNNLLTRIHEYCVYESFSLLGWLYLPKPFSPKKPSIEFNRSLFLSVLNQEFNNTFNDQKKRLLGSMITVISRKTENSHLDLSNGFGTEDFEDIWEKMIDHVFGEDNIEMYFPHAHWHIINDTGESVESSELRPDTIIRLNGKTYIIDAKYYKYGITHNAAHLPATDSIQKQITYAKYVENHKLAERHQIMNAFVMPFSRESENDPLYKFVSVGTADWEDYTPETPDYKYVLGILLDTKHIVMTWSKHNDFEIENLTSLIEKSLIKFREDHPIL